MTRGCMLFDNGGARCRWELGSFGGSSVTVEFEVLWLVGPHMHTSTPPGISGRHRAACRSLQSTTFDPVTRRGRRPPRIGIAYIETLLYCIHRLPLRHPPHCARARAVGHHRTHRPDLTERKVKYEYIPSQTSPRYIQERRSMTRRESAHAGARLPQGPGGGSIRDPIKLHCVHCSLARGSITAGRVGAFLVASVFVTLAAHDGQS